MNAKSSEFRTESLESVQKVDSVVVAVHDTIMETTTITYVLREAQEPDEPEDTVKVTTITERDRIRNRDYCQTGASIKGAMSNFSHI